MKPVVTSSREAAAVRPDRFNPVALAEDPRLKVLLA